MCVFSPTMSQVYIIHLIFPNLSSFWEPQLNVWVSSPADPKRPEPHFGNPCDTTTIKRQCAAKNNQDTVH